MKTRFLVSFLFAAFFAALSASAQGMAGGAMYASMRQWNKAHPDAPAAMQAGDPIGKLIDEMFAEPKEWTICTKRTAWSQVTGIVVSNGQVSYTFLPWSSRALVMTFVADGRGNVLSIEAKMPKTGATIFVERGKNGWCYRDQPGEYKLKLDADEWDAYFREHIVPVRVSL